MSGVLIGIILTFGVIAGVLLVMCLVAFVKSAGTHK